MRIRNRLVKHAVALALLSFGARAQDPSTTGAAELAALARKCDTKLSAAYAYDDGGKKDTYICGDYKGTVHWTADLDIDCDGAQTATCNTTTDPWFQVGTAFGNNVDAAKVPYLVIPNNFNLGNNGIGGGQIAAVVYKGKLTFVVLADTGPAGIIGEASYATAKLLGIDPDPETGGTDGPVNYFVFTGTANRGAVTEAGHADALTKGMALAAQFIKENSGPTGLARASEATPGLPSVGRSLRIEARGAWSLRLRDARGRLADERTGKGPQEASLAGMNAGIYQVELITGGKTARAALPVF